MLCVLKNSRIESRLFSVRAVATFKLIPLAQPGVYPLTRGGIDRGRAHFLDGMLNPIDLLSTIEIIFLLSQITGVELNSLT